MGAAPVRFGVLALFFGLATLTYAILEKGFAILSAFTGEPVPTSLAQET